MILEGTLMEMKVLWVGAAAVIGWIAYYLFARQFVFNFVTGYPLIKKMKAAKEDLIVDNANKYTTTSVVITALFLAIIFFIVLRFCPTYIIISFFGGFAVCGLLLINKTGPSNRKIFDSFCGAYYRFVPDDELRTAMYNMKPSQMKVRLHAMGISTDWIPEFKN